VSDDLRLHLSRVTGIPVVTLTGRADLRDTVAVMAVLDQQLRSQPDGTVVCDLTRMAVPHTEALLTVFPAALHRAGGWPGHSLRLATPGAELSRALARVRMHRFVPVHTTLTEAMSCARRDTGVSCRKIRLAPDPSSSRAARGLIDDVRGRLSRAMRGDAALVVSELTTNAARHVAASFELAVAVAPGQLLVAVTDPSRAEPILRPPRSTAIGGRGLPLVAALSRSWGVQLVHQGGKVVWAALDTGFGRASLGA